MSTDDTIRAIAGGVEAIRTDVTAGLEQGRITIAMLRDLISLLAPREEGRASLEDLLAALIAMLREINDKADDALAGIRRLEGRALIGDADHPTNGSAANARP
jgi:hypothetical protein